MTDRDEARGDEALVVAAARLQARMADIDLGDDLGATLERTPSGPVGARPQPRRIPMAAWTVAASIVAITAGFLVLSRGSNDERIASGDPEPTIATTAPTTDSPPPEMTTIEPDPNPNPAPVVDNVTSTTIVAPTTLPADPGPCLAGVESPQIANELFVEQMLIARTGDGVLASCLDAVPGAYDGMAPNCWTTCEGYARTFIKRSVRFGEFFSPPSNDARYSGSISVSYSSGDEYIDVAERWELIRTDTGWRFDDFGVESYGIERTASSDVINAYFSAVEAGDWTRAAAFLNDGAINSEERTDLQRLAPASFELSDIAAALEAWCADGCDTRRVEPGELTFDVSYSLHRRGHVIDAAWFEGVYSIGGLPFRGDGSTGPETFSLDDLVDGVDLAIDGHGLVRAVLFAPDSLSERDAASLEAAGSGELVPSALADDRFDQMWLVRGDPWCSRRPVITTELTPAGTSGSNLNVHVGQPADFESSDNPSCADVQALAIGFDWVEGIVAFNATVDSGDAGVSSGG